ncbi:ABC transporter substrate-binding protein [Gluconacetobacter takamatsuzukensis]|uniref:ABC transporter substrate-binding protein n=2 Tax=Gluconacetobacter takamatsuzukensis TaxID=1286190 RepID=A0A7W4PMR4_9PROT|nr:ABC transporter substrate-binding protein [Gluconacetobacter takamatsuzukensis]
MRGWRRCGTVLLAVVLAGGARAEPRHRIVSLNLCTDQLLLQLVPARDIAGLSPLARDCAYSVMCLQARSVPAIRPSAEAVVAARPDLVVGGRYASVTALLAARQAGMPVELFDPVERLADVPDQIAAVANAAGVPERGRALVDAFRARLAAYPVSAGGNGAPSAMIYAANGFVTRAGSLADDMLVRAGFRNAANGLDGRHALGVSLESLLARPPDLLVVARSDVGISLAQAVLDHPALRDAFPAAHRLSLPDRLWLCGLPQTLDTLDKLIAARKALETSR